MHIILKKKKTRPLISQDKKHFFNKCGTEKYSYVTTALFCNMNSSTICYQWMSPVEKKLMNVQKDLHIPYIADQQQLDINEHLTNTLAFEKL